MSGTSSGITVAASYDDKRPAYKCPAKGVLAAEAWLIPARWRDYKLRDGLLDAAICAWAAAYWHRYALQRSQVLGLSEQPTEEPLATITIIAPVRREQRRS